MKSLILGLVFVSLSSFSQERLVLDGEMVPKEKFRSTYSHLSDESYEQKLKGSLESPLLFFRSFVNTYYEEFKNQKQSTLKNTCFGDAHPENFGFILFDQQTRFVFNDLDDSGECSIEFDLLRYFTALSLSFNEQALNDELLAHFIEVSQDHSKAQLIDSKLIADLEKKNKKILKEYISSDKFHAHEDVILLDPEAVEEKLLILKKESLFKKIIPLDMVQVKRETGGSGGLERFWLLVKGTDAKLDILELKEIARSGLSFLQTQSYRSIDDRFDNTKSELWGASPLFYHPITFNGADYLVRSRTKDDVKLEKLQGADLHNYLKSQVSMLALHHSRVETLDPQKMGRWLKLHLPVLKNRYLKSYQYLLKTLK